MKKVAADTNALVRFLGYDMISNNASASSQAMKLFDSIFSGEHFLYISAISFVEIWARIKQTDEAVNKFSSVNVLLGAQENVKIVRLGMDIIEAYSKLQAIPNIKEHDRIIVATAIEYECDTLITSDEVIHNNSHHIPGITLIHS